MTRRTYKWLTALAFASLFLARPLNAQNRDSNASANGEKKPEVTAEASDANQGTTNTETTASSSTSSRQEHEEISWGNPLVSIGKDVELKAGQTAEAVVVIGGSAKVHGKVHEAVVVIGGDVDLDGEVGETVVAVFGNINARPGAKINGDAVAVGGKVDVAEGASVLRPSPNLQLPDLKWLRKYFTHCVLFLRPLAPEVGWIWPVAGIFFLFYLLVAALFPRPVEACVSELTRRPATTFLMGLLTKMLLPIIFVILIATGVGALVLPFVIAGIFLGTIVGKVALFEWLGLKLGRHFGEGTQKPLIAFVLGSLIITILYCIPFIGLLMLLVVSVWGLGGAVNAAFFGLRKEMPERPARATSSVPVYNPAPAMAASGFAPSGMGMVSPGSSAGPAAAPAEQSVTATLPLQSNPPVMPESLSYPRASFWERLGAGFLDFVLIGILGGAVGVAPLGLLIALAYFAGMWTWKGTTVGGIVLGLKVVRVDGQPVTFAVALVRALAAGFSVIVLFLGFLWIAWDREKQGWHDRIAGTVVLRLPRGTPLILY
jgi:uncharacterized RDD family membrane protein YckC